MINNFNEINHEKFMQEAIKEANEAGTRGDRPIGAVIVHNGKIIARGSNRFYTADNEIAHAENTAIFSCASYLKKYGRECILYTTVEPCIMCLTTIVMANIRNVVYAVEDKYMNMNPFIESNPYIKDRLHNYLGGVLMQESLDVINSYFPFMAKVILEGIK
ncbi:nucleoside deaminase [Clostridium sp.]|uniref:nucleoside deaminase n=1 Tax=Clostridium sp. TaxID=1506 RepID=UPI002FC7C981